MIKKSLFCSKSLLPCVYLSILILILSSPTYTAGSVHHRHKRQPTSRVTEQEQQNENAGVSSAETETEVDLVTGRNGNEQQQQQQVHVNNVQQQDNVAASTTTILDMDFVRDFKHFNPRDESSVFQWYSVDVQNKCDNAHDKFYTADNAAFLRSDDGVLTMSTTPFDRWLSSAAVGLNASQAAYDAAVVVKQPVKIGKKQILRVSLKFRCETFNTGQHAFGDKAVTNALDDPRLAACALYLVDNDITGIELGILLTNKGIWAAYGNQEYFRALIGANYRAYNIYRRLGSRPENIDELIDARIEVDRAKKETRYYIDDKLEWRVTGGWGAPSVQLVEDEQTRLVSMTDGQLLPVLPKSYSVFIMNSHKMDLADPNNMHVLGDENKALMKYVTQDGYYGLATAENNLMQFWNTDSDSSQRKSTLYGQCAKAGLKRLLIERFTSET